MGIIKCISIKKRFFIFECQLYEIIIKIRLSGPNKIFRDNFLIIIDLII